MIWNEPNNKSHWDPAIDPDWQKFATMVTLGCQAIRAENSTLPRVLGGMSPIDPHWLRRIEGHGALNAVDVVAVHGFPLDWNLWPLSAWPTKIAEIKMPDLNANDIEAAKKIVAGTARSMGVTIAE